MSFSLIGASAGAFRRMLFGAAALSAGLSAAAYAQAPTTSLDFDGPGTQPGTLSHAMMSPSNCQLCHGFPSSEGDYTEEQAQYDRWAASMMGQATRDPIFLAALAIANQDAGDAGSFCLRCHSPVGWLNGNSLPPDGSALTNSERQGVTCAVCHRMVDLSYTPGVNPPPDQSILAGLTSVPLHPGGGEYVIDPLDRRRGPYDVETDWIPLGGFLFHPDATYMSPFHKKSSLCGTCHDVSNPVFIRQPDGRYAFDPQTLNEPHPTGNKYDQFPVERTYSEWLMSAFAQGPIDMGGRFGGLHPQVSTCQDCHMATTIGHGCAIEPPLRGDLPQHNFNGANTWVLKAIRYQYFDSQTGLSADSVADSVARAETMLQLASDMELAWAGDDLSVRIINQTGHKLPTGYPEGRRMWLNVRFLDDADMLVLEHGAYDELTAELTHHDTKVYEMELGLDTDVATATGLPVGPSFHFALNNKIYYDNRIPPRGFTNANFASVQAAPVGYAYADGQYWDDTHFAIPPGATKAEVTLFHQTTTKEYIEFLRDENYTDLTGLEAYDLWLLFGMSPPIVMDQGVIEFDLPGDTDDDGDVDLADYLVFQTCLDMSGPGVVPASGSCLTYFDADSDSDVDMADGAAFQAVFTGS